MSNCFLWICTFAAIPQWNFDKLNLACDAGATFAEAAALLDDAADAACLEQYVERYTRTVPHKIQGTWDILYELKAKGVRVFAITNWSAETWPEGCKAHPELAEAFAALTRGRQKSYVIAIGGAKKPETRMARIAKYRPKMLDGKGAMDR